MPSLINRWCQYYREVVKCTLVTEPVHSTDQDTIREVLRRVIESYENRDFNVTLLMLGALREFIFPINTDPIIQPEQFTPRFVDFMLDEGMWEKIRLMRAHSKDPINRILNEINIPFIVKDLIEMVDQDEIFARQDDGR